jgi:hypothetical protein
MLRRFVAKIVVNGKAGTLYYTFPLANLARGGEMPQAGLEPATTGFEDRYSIH